MTTKQLQTRRTIEQALHGFEQGSFMENARALLQALGYRSEKRIDLVPNTPENFVVTFDQGGKLNSKHALLHQWQSVDLLFQLTGDEIVGDGQVRIAFASSTRVDNAITESYLFFAVELRGEAYTRTQLANITREINKLFPMPVIVLFRHGATLTLSIIKRRLHKRDESKAVLEKVTLIKDIVFTAPHGAHIEIFYDLSLARLYEQHRFANFVDLHRAWQQTLDSSELNKRFFREIANWYFWAVQNVAFPKDAGNDIKVRNATSVIRLITRLIFVWLLKEKELVPDVLFNQRMLREMLTYADPQGSTYYKAILQNLFFATLNQEMNTPQKPDHRKFRSTGGRHYNSTPLYRYKRYFKRPDEALRIFASIPFLSGDLFGCLDKPDKDDPTQILRIDGFSDRPDNELVVPDWLFFSPERPIDLNAVYGTTNKRYTVHGLIDIFNRYKFTIDENTLIEEEFALDPELLGKVFENLLATYNLETGVTARKQTGSFYTPREIVDYIVDESLIAYFQHKLDEGATDSAEQDPTNVRLRQLFAYNDEPHQFSEREVARLIEAIDNVKILDPACGSGAFLMGVLHKLVFILAKLDPQNRRRKDKQIAKASQIDHVTSREKAIDDVEQAFECHELDYGRKLYLIENCIYGVDIQPIAVQIAKLRFFISLIMDEKIDDTRENRGIRPLPNLETKFVAANTLIGIDHSAQLALRDPEIDQKEQALAEVHRQHFIARTPMTKRTYRERDTQLRKEIAELLKRSGFPGQTAEQLARWSPYDQHASADFFDPEWMFGISDGFDVVLGNPPYRFLSGKASPVRQLIKAGKVEEALELKRLFDIIAKRFPATSIGCRDYYKWFIEAAFTFAKPKGVVTFITPNTFITLKNYTDVRSFLVKVHDTRLIVDIGFKTFEASSVPAAIFITNKAQPLSININYSNLKEMDRELLKVSNLRGLVIDNLLKVPFDGKRLLLYKSELAEKLYTTSEFSLHDYIDISEGEHDLQIDLSQHISAYSPNALPVVNDREMQRYITAKTIYIPRELCAKFNLQLHSGKRFFIRKTGDRIIAAPPEDFSFAIAHQNVYVAHPRSETASVYLLLGIVSSSLLSFLYQDGIYGQKGRTLAQFRIYALYLLPIPDLMNPVCQSIDIAVRRIFELTQGISTPENISENSEILALEWEIDRLVYRLYDLLPEEIAIVEEATRRK